MQTTTPTVEQAHEALLAAQRRERIAREGYRLATQAADAAVAHRRYGHAYDEMNARAEAQQSTAIVRDGVRGLGMKLLEDYFSRVASGRWEHDRELFTKLYLLGQVVPASRQELPTPMEADYLTERDKR